MSRPLRIEYEGAWYHVMNRGTGRRDIFHTDQHRLLFLELLNQVHQKFKIEIHAYCLMRNHYHLLMRTPLANLQKAMRHLNGIYALRYNRDRKTEDELQLFYKQPNLSKFIQLTSNLINQPKAEKLLLIFSTMVIHQHPEYGTEISKNFQHYSVNEQRLLYTALLASENKNSADYITKTYRYKKDIQPFLTANDIKNLKINNPNHLDYSWVAFFATGDNLYLKKILEFINADDYFLIAGYEIVNRKHICDAMKQIGDTCNNKNDTSDIIEAIKKRYPTNSKEMIYKAFTVAAGIWSLESNRRQDPEINKRVNELIKANPNLDYWKKIKKWIQ